MKADKFIIICCCLLLGVAVVILIRNGIYTKPQPRYKIVSPTQQERISDQTKSESTTSQKKKFQQTKPKPPILPTFTSERERWKNWVASWEKEGYQILTVEESQNWLKKHPEVQVSGIGKFALIMHQDGINITADNNDEIRVMRKRK